MIKTRIDGRIRLRQLLITNRVVSQDELPVILSLVLDNSFDPIPIKLLGRLLRIPIELSSENRM